MIIIRTERILEVGKIYGDAPGDFVGDHNGQDHQIRFLVKRVATIDEFWEQIQDLDIPDQDKSQIADELPGMNFYEILTD